MVPSVLFENVKTALLKYEKILVSKHVHWCLDLQQNDTQHNDSQQTGWIVTLSMTLMLHTFYCYAECHYAYRHYAERHNNKDTNDNKISMMTISITILSLIALSIMTVSKMTLSIPEKSWHLCRIRYAECNLTSLLRVTMLSVIILSVVMLSVIILSAQQSNKPVFVHKTTLHRSGALFGYGRLIIVLPVSFKDRSLCS